MLAGRLGPRRGIDRDGARLVTIGRTGDGIGFFVRGLQYFCAGLAALYLPTYLLKHSNLLIVVTIFGTLTFLVGTVSIGLVAFSPELSQRYGLHDWLGAIASYVGLLASCFAYKEFTN